jgi:uncharacterized damage-inducible protein DinB
MARGKAKLSKTGVGLRWTSTGSVHTLRRSTTPRKDEPIMSISANLLPEFDEEMASTRRVLERVPDDKPDWKPHPKSFSIAHLAQLVAWLPGWIAQTLTNTELELASGSGYSNQSTKSLSDGDYEVPWSLKLKGNVLMTSPRRVVVRQHISHLSHHRGQLTVYLRLLDVPVPSVYGPTADEKWG